MNRWGMWIFGFMCGIAMGAGGQPVSGREVCVAICDGPATVDEYDLCVCDGDP